MTDSAQTEARFEETSYIPCSPISILIFDLRHMLKIDRTEDLMTAFHAQDTGLDYNT